MPLAQLTRAEKNMFFMEKYLTIPEGENAGQPMVLLPSVEDFFYAIFDNPHGTKTGIYSIARKNAKTTAIACLLICFLVGPEAKQNTQIVSGAMSKEQASIVFKLAKLMIQKSDDLRDLVKIIPSSKILIGLPMNVEYRALAADGHTAQGLSVYLGIIDECGQVRGPESEFINAITTSQGAHGGKGIIIYLSTQAATDADFLSIIIDDAIRSQDTHTVCHLYEAPKGCDLLDRDAWKAANPGLGICRSVEDLEKLMEEAVRMPSKENSVRNLCLNQRVTVHSLFVSQSVWEENGAQPEPFAKKKAYGGLDLSAVSDLTALVMVSEEGDVDCTFWLPQEGLVEKSKTDRVPYDVWERQGFLKTCPGRAIEYEYVAKQLKIFFTMYNVQQINFDRYNMKFLRPWLAKEGFSESDMEKFQDFGQGFVSMSPALRDLETRLLQKKLKHGNHPVLTMCAGNAAVEMDAVGGRKFTKRKSTGRIDGMVSLAMAVSAANNALENTEKKFQMFFV